MSELDDIRERVVGHTPGPWRGDYLVMAGPVGSNEQDGWVYGDDILARDPDIALIAAAPDLLRIATEQAQRIETLEKAVNGYRSIAQSREAEIEQYEWLLDQAKTRVEELETALALALTYVNNGNIPTDEDTETMNSSLAGDTKTGTQLCQEADDYDREHDLRLRAEMDRDEALQREAKNADKLHHYRTYFMPETEIRAERAERERDRLREHADALWKALKRLQTFTDTASRWNLAEAALDAYRKETE